MFRFSEKPILTAMLQAQSPERLLELIEKGITLGAEAFGLQLERLPRKYHTPDIFRSVFAAMNGRPCYVTCYRYLENEGMTDQELAEELLLAAKCGGTLMDIMGDLYDAGASDQLTRKPEAVQKQKELINALHQIGKQVLISSHTDRFMTAEEVLDDVCTQHEHGADIAKVVSIANNEKALYEAHFSTARLAKEMKKPFLYLCAGTHCAPHRRIAPFIAGGLFLTVVEYDEFSTPFQPLLSDAVALCKQFCP